MHKISSIFNKILTAGQQNRLNGVDISIHYIEKSCLAPDVNILPTNYDRVRAAHRSNIFFSANLPEKKGKGSLSPADK